MPTTDEYRAELRALPEEDVPAYLTERSGLPGPRSNLSLLDAFGDVAPAAVVLRLADVEDEYLRSCGTAAVGRLLLEAGPADRPALVDLLHDRAADPSWRVREATAMAVQRLGDGDPVRLREMVATWAAVAGICEPRLLADPLTARAALDACQVATDGLVATAADRRRDPDVRTLRQGLGYCWSVAVAGNPAEGLPRFAALAGSADPDIAWIDRENRKKARLRRLTEAGRKTRSGRVQLR